MIAVQRIGGVGMDTELLTITAILAIAAWVTLRLREFKTEAVVVPADERDDPN